MEEGTDEGGEHALPGAKKKSPLPLIVGIVAVVGVAIGAVVMMGGGGEPKTESTAVVAPVAPPVDPRAEAARRELDRAIAFQRDNPTEYVDILLFYDAIAGQYAGVPAAAEAAQKRSEALDGWRKAVEAARAKLETDVAAHVAAEHYKDALALLASPDPVLRDSDDQFGGENPLYRWVGRQKKEIGVLATAQSRLEDLERKAAKYPEHVEIAIAILQEGFPEVYQSEAEPVWLRRDATIAAIQKDGLKGWLEKERGAEVARAEASRVAAEEEERRRKERWESLLGSLEWTPHIGKHNLYNWIATSDTIRILQDQPRAWKVQVREGEPTLIAENSTGTEMFLGPFTNHWKDYVLEFEVRVLKGKLSLSPRTTLGAGDFVLPISDQTSPMFAFSEENGVALGKWVPIEVVVYDDAIEAKIDGGAKKLVLEKETTRVPDTGGFVFFIADGHSVEIRKVRTKLVNSTRDGPF